MGGDRRRSRCMRDRGSYWRHPGDYETALLEALIDGKLLGVFSGPGHQRLVRIRAELGVT